MSTIISYFSDTILSTSELKSSIISEWIYFFYGEFAMVYCCMFGDMFRWGT